MQFTIAQANIVNRLKIDRIMLDRFINAIKMAEGLKALSFAFIGARFSLEEAKNAVRFAIGDTKVVK